MVLMEILNPDCVRPNSGRIEPGERVEVQGESQRVHDIAC